MTKRPLVPGIIGALFVIAGCADDPTSSLREGIDAVSTSVNYVEVAVGDAVAVTAEARDAQGNALEVLPTVTSANPAVATVIVDEERSGQPAPSTIFNIVGVSFGETVVTAEAGGVSTTITVRTVPDALNIPNFPATLASGTSITLAPEVVGSDGTVIAGLTVTWVSLDTDLATIDATGLLTALSPKFEFSLGGLLRSVAIRGTVKLDDAAVNGKFNTANVIAEASTFITSVAFTGTLSATSVTSGQFLTITRAAGEPAFDSDTEVFIDGAETTVASFAADTIRVALAAFTDFGVVDLVTTNVGPDQISLTTTITQSAPLPFDGAITDGVRGDVLVVTFGSVAFTGAETVGPVDGSRSVLHQIDADGSTITFLAEDFGVGAHTLQINGVGADGIAFSGTFNLTGNAPVLANTDDTAPTALPTTFPQGYLVWLTSTSPSDFHSIDNTTGADLDFTATMGWSTAGVDADIIFRDCTTLASIATAFTLANPEVLSATIPAGDCYVIEANLYSGPNVDVGFVLTQ